MSLLQLQDALLADNVAAAANVVLERHCRLRSIKLADNKPTSVDGRMMLDGSTGVG